MNRHIGFWSLLMVCLGVLALAAKKHTRENVRKTVLDEENEGGVFDPNIVDTKEEVSEYGPWIVQMEDTATLARFSDNGARIASKYKSHPIHARALSEHPFQVIKSLTPALNGVYMEGLTREDVESIEGVKVVGTNNKKYLHATTSWGTDRIDQPDMPLSGSYDPAFTGVGVDIYIIDSGIDTLHDEFAAVAGVNRDVMNIWDAYSSTIEDNNDIYGHGSHVAGTAGGNTAGVAPAANIYGLKAFGDDGGGYDTDIIDAINYAIANIQADGRRGVINLSSGGSCDNPDCSTDALVVAVEYAISQGVVVTVSAGNEYCNCADQAAGSPASAPNAITVAALKLGDRFTYQSNYGQVIDIFAPGSSVNSVCSEKYWTGACSGSESSYMKMTGTSMAAPHVAGVAAQLLQKKSDATPAEVVNAMLCDAAYGKVWGPNMQTDTLTRNLIVQVPANDGLFGTCNNGDGCTDDCNGRGVCMPAHLSATYGTTANKCFCDMGYDDTSNCAELTKDVHADNCANGMEVSVKMYVYDPGYPEGWYYQGYGIYDTTGDANIVDNAADGFCTTWTTSQSDTRDHCLRPGTYTFAVQDSGAGSVYNEYNSWEFCGISGVGGYTTNFDILYDAGSNTYTCTTGPTQSPTASPVLGVPSRTPTITPTKSFAPTFNPPTRAPTTAPPTRSPTLTPSVSPTSTHTPTDAPFAAEQAVATNSPTKQPRRVRSRSEGSVNTKSESGKLYIGIIIVGCVIFVAFYLIFYFFYARYYSKEEIMTQITDAPKALPKMVREATKRANFGGSGITANSRASLTRAVSSGSFHMNSMASRGASMNMNSMASRGVSMNIGSNELQEYDEDEEL